MVRPIPHLEKIRRDSDIISGRDGLVCLDRNERASAFDDDVFEGMLGTLNSAIFSTYPDLGPLYQAITATNEIEQDRIAIGAGSDGIIRRVFQAFLSAGDMVVVPDPTYGMYAVWSRVFQADFQTVPYGEGPHFSFDEEAIIAKIKDGARICCIANPDQPTGSVLGLEALRRIATVCEQSDTLFLIDEAYYPSHAQTARPLIDEFANTLVVRTFSKVAGIAGLRVGYALGSPNVIAALHVVRSPGEVNAVGAAVAKYILDHPEIIEGFRVDLEDGRAMLVAEANELGFFTPKCAGNFQLMLCPAGIEPQALQLALKDRGYLIKGGFGHPGLERYVRVTLDKPTIIKPFVTALRGVVMALTGKQ